MEFGSDCGFILHSVFGTKVTLAIGWNP